MLKDFHLLNDHEVVIIGRHTQHHAVLNVQGDLASISVLPAIVQPLEEEDFHMLQPANKSDRMCHLVAMTMRSSCPSISVLSALVQPLGDHQV